jgi:hypothetical protein
MSCRIVDPAWVKDNCFVRPADFDTEESFPLLTKQCDGYHRNQRMFFSSKPWEGLVGLAATSL